MLVALAVASRFGEKFVSVCSERLPCDWARSLVSVRSAVPQGVYQDRPLLFLSTLCISLSFRLDLFGRSGYSLASAGDNNVQGDGRVLGSSLA